MPSSTLLRAACAAAIFLASAAGHAADKPASADALTPAQSRQLLDDVRTLASPAYDGRKTATEGSAKAQAYIQARFAAMSLQHYGSSYARPFTFVPRRGPQTPVAGVNLVGFIPGSTQSQRVIVLSAHYDHLGTKDGALYPGADDNASGVAAILAMAAWFKAHPPLHTIVIAAFDGEEMGLRGANAFIADLPFPRAQLAFNLNLDMVSHNDRNEIYVAGTSFHPELKSLVEQVAARTSVSVKMGHDRGAPTGSPDEDWTMSSDHGPFHTAGVPFLYFGVEDHADYHKPGDTFEHINQPFFTQVGAMLIDVAATLDQRIDAK